MLDARHVTEHFDEVRSALLRRSPAAAASLGAIAELAGQRRALIAQTEARQARRNAANGEMSELAKGPDRAAFEARREELKVLSSEIKTLEAELAQIESRVQDLLLGVPNVPHDTTPSGRGADDNPVVRTWGQPPSIAFQPRQHWELGERLGILDFERAAKLSGARFAVLWGDGARLERALVSFMLDLHTGEQGYREVYPPYLVRAQALRGTGQLPKFEADLFKTYRRGPSAAAQASGGGEQAEPQRPGAGPTGSAAAGAPPSDEDDALYLIPTAEVPVTNLHADEILDGASLPLAYTAYTPCFRSEAGSYGQDVRGLIRQHQFDKVELVRFVEPETALDQLELLTQHAEEVLRRLGLHYRVVSLCAGDLGSSATKTYDLEVWLPGQGAYREISSCSTFGDYQARRAKIRYRADIKAKPRLVHTLNGSALAVGRTLVAILEQCQQADGSILLPDVLRPLMGKERLVPG